MVYGDPPIFKSPHHSIYAQTHPANFSTFYAPSDTHLWCAIQKWEHVRMQSYRWCWAWKHTKSGYYLGQLEECAQRLPYESGSVITLCIHIYIFTPPLPIHLGLSFPHLHLDKLKFSFSSCTYPHLSPECAILVNTGILPVSLPKRPLLLQVILILITQCQLLQYSVDSTRILWYQSLALS